MKKPFTLLVALAFSFSLVVKVSAEDNRKYEVHSAARLLETFQADGMKAKVIEWFKESAPERLAEFADDEAEIESDVYQVLALEYFLNMQGEKGWDLLAIDGNTYIFKKRESGVVRVRRVPAPAKE